MMIAEIVLHVRPSILKPPLQRQLTSISEGGLSNGTGPQEMAPIGVGGVNPAAPCK